MAEGDYTNSLDGPYIKLPYDGGASAYTNTEIPLEESNHSYSSEQLERIYGKGAILFFKLGYKTGPLSPLGLTTPLKIRKYKKRDYREGIGYFKKVIEESQKLCRNGDNLELFSIVCDLVGF